LGGETVNTAVFLLNRAPTQSVDGKTPYEVWHGVNPPVHFLLTFGYVAHVKNSDQRLIKIDERSTPMVFVGYEARTKVFLFYNPMSRRVHVLRDVMFEEERSLDWGADKGAGPDDDVEPFQVEHYTLVPVGQGGSAARTPHAASAPATTTSPTTPSQTEMPSPGAGTRTPAPTSTPMLTVNSCSKVRLDLQADKSPVVVKGPFFPRVVNPRYRIRGTNV
jgi:hypothetical protein